MLIIDRVSIPHFRKPFSRRPSRSIVTGVGFGFLNYPTGNTGVSRRYGIASVIGFSWRPSELFRLVRLPLRDMKMEYQMVETRHWLHDDFNPYPYNYHINVKDYERRLVVSNRYR